MKTLFKSIFFLLYYVYFADVHNIVIWTSLNGNSFMFLKNRSFICKRSQIPQNSLVKPKLKDKFVETLKNI